LRVGRLVGDALFGVEARHHRLKRGQVSGLDELSSSIIARSCDAGQGQLPHLKEVRGSPHGADVAVTAPSRACGAIPPPAKSIRVR
jgi:hypothetical protein